MGRKLSDLTFEAWVTSIFDHPVPNDPGDPNAPPWYDDDDDDSQSWDPLRQPEVTVAYLTKLFEGAPHLLTPFSDTQINQGFNFLVSNSLSAHMLVLFNAAVPWSERKHCISSMYTLFERFFAPRCFSHLSHLDTGQTATSDVSPLNEICYMWWDTLHYYGNPANPDSAEVGAACLEVM